MKEGNLVYVYEDPLTETKLESQVELVEFLSEDAETETWLVQFPDGNIPVTAVRRIKKFIGDSKTLILKNNQIDIENIAIIAEKEAETFQELIDNAIESLKLIKPIPHEILKYNKIAVGNVVIKAKKTDNTLNIIQDAIVTLIAHREMGYT